MTENYIDLNPADILNIADILDSTHGEYQGGVPWKTLVVRVVDAIDEYRNPPARDYQMRMHHDGSAVRWSGGEWHWLYPPGQVPAVVPDIPDVSGWKIVYEGDG